MIGSTGPEGPPTYSSTLAWGQSSTSPSPPCPNCCSHLPTSLPLFEIYSLYTPLRTGCGLTTNGARGIPRGLSSICPCTVDEEAISSCCTSWE